MPSEERAFAPVAQAKFSICLTRRSETEIRRLRQNVYLCNFPVFAKRRFASNPLSSGSSGKCSFAIAKKLQNLTQIISDRRTPLTSRFSAADADRYTFDGHPFLMRFGFFCATCMLFGKCFFKCFKAAHDPARRESRLRAHERHASRKRRKHRERQQRQKRRKRQRISYGQRPHKARAGRADRKSSGRRPRGPCPLITYRRRASPCEATVSPKAIKPRPSAPS